MKKGVTILGLLSLFIIFPFSIVFAINFGISTDAPSADLRDNPRDEAADAGCYECQSRQHSELTITTQSLPEGTVGCLLYTSPSPRDAHESRMPSSA